MNPLRWVPTWLIVLIVIAILAFIGNKLGIINIHFRIGGDIGF